MSAAGDNLRRMADRAEDGGNAAARSMGRAAEDEIKKQLTKRSHGPGPTNSPPGQPPARVSGALSGSVDAGLPFSLGGDRWAIEVGPRGIVYARIQDKGGVAGRNHASVLPPRPYMAPARREGGMRISEAGHSALVREVFG
jgi:phage gpG-like protein